MTYPKAQMVRVLDDSKLYEIIVNGLKETDKYPPKASFEIRHITKAQDMRSFRTESLVKVENLIVGMVRAYAFMRAAKGLFGNPIEGHKITKDATELQSTVMLITEHLRKKIEQGMFDGVRHYKECK